MKLEHKPAVTQVIQEEQFVLSLSRDEAEVIASLLVCVGGSLDGPRGVTSAIWGSLNQALGPNSWDVSLLKYKAQGLDGQHKSLEIRLRDKGEIL
jgi:hypothetical protein